MTPIELEERQQIYEQDVKLFIDAQKVFDNLHPKTRMKIVSKDKLMYNIMCSAVPVTKPRWINNPESQMRSYNKFLEFKKIYDPKFLEIKTEQDFKNLSKDFQQHFKEYFPGEFSTINLNQ